MSSAGRTLTIFVAALAAMSLMLSAGPTLAAPSDPQEPETHEVTAYGYIANLSNQAENTPLENVTVTLYDSDKNVLEDVSGSDSVNTDGTGRFEFTFMYTDGETYFLTFDYPGYMVRSLPDPMSMDDDGFVSFRLMSSQLDGEGKYALSGEAGGLHAIVMAVTTGIVYGTVQGVSGEESFALSGATVTVTSEDGMSYTTKTGAGGYFSIECPYGSYTMTVVCKGFQSSEAIDVESGYGSAYNIDLTQNESTYLFGLDIAHSVMLIGLVILALTVGAAVAANARSRKKGAEPILMNDLDDLSQQNDEDVRRL